MPRRDDIESILIIGSGPIVSAKPASLTTRVLKRVAYYATRDTASSSPTPIPPPL